MGKTVVRAKFSNTHDIADVKRGFMQESEIRSLECEGVVDTGAVLVSLTKRIVDQLGLDIVTEKRVRYANGQVETKAIAGGLLVEIQGRNAEVRCVVQDDASPMLIGQIALAEMDWAVHPQTQRLIPGHEGEHEMALIEMYYQSNQSY
jgi:predicted aspartyl protease